MHDNLPEALRIAPEALRIAPRVGIYYCAVCTDKEKFKDPDICKVLSPAISREIIVWKVLRAREVPAYVPPGTRITPLLVFPGKIYPVPTRLGKAGYSAENPLRAPLFCNTLGNYKRVAFAVQNMGE